MELYKEILAKAFSDENKIIIFPGINLNAAEIVEQSCYKALSKIKSAIDDDGLDDKACFYKIEAVVRVFEELGSSCDRHDF